MPAVRNRDTHPAQRSLEVSIPAPPALTIISPTPRAFTFPITHNLGDSPYSSPSNSPFEPDLRALALSAASTPVSSVSGHDHDDAKSPPAPNAPLPLSAFTRTLSPLPAPPAHVAAVSSPAQPPVRRKSLGGNADCAAERRPKKGDEDYVKRPENAFILFRRHCCADRAALSAPSDADSQSHSAPASLVDGPNSADSTALGKKARQADLSKTISAQWRSLPSEERAKWEALAREKKREHAERHPGYVYRPQRRAAAAVASPVSPASPSKRRKGSIDPSASTSSQPNVEFVVPTARTPHARSMSAPTPPPYQAIQIPNVYMGLGAPPVSPNEPSLLPMIASSSRKSSSGSASGFDYLPSSSFGAGPSAYEFEASLQSSDFLRAMFPAGGELISPASSTTSGSGPSSPYTPAATAPTFNLPASYPSSQPSSVFHPYHNHSDGPALLDAASPLDPTSCADPWATTNPWMSFAAPAAALAPGDFDLAGIPEIGWALGESVFPGGAPEGEYDVAGQGEGGKGLDLSFGMDFGMGMGSMGEGMGLGMEMEGMDMNTEGMDFDALIAGEGF